MEREEERKAGGDGGIILSDYKCINAYIYKI